MHWNMLHYLSRVCLCLSVLSHRHLYIARVLRAMIKNRLTLTLWMARPWHAASPLICWTRLPRPLKSQNTTWDMRPPSTETTTPSCPINGHNLQDSTDLYSSSLHAQRPSARLTSLIKYTHTFLEAKYSGEASWRYFKTKNVISTWRGIRIDLKLLLQQLRAVQNMLCSLCKLVFCCLDFNFAFLFMTSCRQWGGSQ